MSVNTKSLKVCRVEYSSTEYDIICAVDSLDDINDIIQDWAVETLGTVIDLPNDLVYTKDITDTSVVLSALTLDGNVYLRSAVSSYMDVPRYAGISGDFPTLPTTLTAGYYVAPECYAFLYSEADMGGFFGKNLIAEKSLTLSEGINYIGIRYNAGSPEWIRYADSTTFDYSSIFPVAIVIDYSDTLHVIPYGQYGYGLPEKLQQNDFVPKVTSTFTLETSSNYVTLSALTAKKGVQEFSCDEVDTSDAGIFYQYHKADTGVWTKTTRTTINNTQYQTTASGLGTLGAGKFVINQVYRLLHSSTDMIFTVLSGSFDSLAEAKESEMVSELPSIVEDGAVLVGRIIVEQASTSPTIQKVQNVWFGTVS